MVTHLKNRDDGQMLSVVAPGQGAQTSGFLSPWLELESFEKRLHWYCAVLDLDLIHFGTEASDETIRSTDIAQPLLVAASLATAAELFTPGTAAGDDVRETTDSDSRADSATASTDSDKLPLTSAVGVLAGHSVGEIVAAALAGIISEESALVFVRERGKAMAKAASLAQTSMIAVLAGKEPEVLDAIAEAGLTAANYNGAGQIVAAGTVEQINAFSKNPPARTRLVQLSVAGAFHTVHMAPAVDRLAELAASMPCRNALVPVLSNRDGQAVTNGADYVDRLVRQVALPVRWDLCMSTMADSQVTGMLELAPAGTLVGIAKRNLKTVERFALTTPDDLPAARDFVRAHMSGMRGEQS